MQSQPVLLTTNPCLAVANGAGGTNTPLFFFLCYVWGVCDKIISTKQKEKI